MARTLIAQPGVVASGSRSAATVPPPVASISMNLPRCSAAKLQTMLPFGSSTCGSVQFEDLNYGGPPPFRFRVGIDALIGEPL